MQEFASLFHFYSDNLDKVNDQDFDVEHRMGKESSYQAKQPNEQGNIFYTDEEHAMWKALYARQISPVERYAAPEFLNGLHALNLPTDKIPNCSDVSDYLRSATGWTIEPVPALINFKRFFRMLSERIFPAASFIRNKDDFDYVREPDIFHEIFGHTPLLTDDRFAAFTAAIGRVGSRANPSDYSWIARLYWFTIEFGLIEREGMIYPLGSGLVSSPSELVYAAISDEPERRPFELLDVLRTPYRIDIHQPIYYVLDDLDTLFELADRDLLKDVRKAQSRGLFEPTYPAT